jgi:hypothetical protein
MSVRHKQLVSTIISDAKDYLGVSIHVLVARTLRFGTLNCVLAVPVQEQQYNNPLIILTYCHHLPLPFHHPNPKTATNA